MAVVAKVIDGVLVVAPTFVHAPGYSLSVADTDPATPLPDGWTRYADAVTEEDFAPPWRAPVGAREPYALGALVSHQGQRWRSAILGNVWEPGVSGWVDADSDIPAWVQPSGAHDAYAPGAIVKHGGKIWRNTLDAEGSANVWAPGVSGWREAARMPPSGAAPAPPAWVPPTGAHDAYGIGDRVTHAGQIWTCTVASNVWEPGVYGWTAD